LQAFQFTLPCTGPVVNTVAINLDVFIAGDTCLQLYVCAIAIG